MAETVEQTGTVERAGKVEQIGAIERSGDINELETKARTLQQEYVKPRIDWYKTHTRGPRLWFRFAGVATIVFSVTLPALAAGTFRYKDVALSVLSIAIAALTGLSTFFHWERTWRGNTNAQMALEHHVAKWELDMANARLTEDAAKRMNQVYNATGDLLMNASAVVSSESEGFFSSLQFPQHSDETRSR